MRLQGYINLGWTPKLAVVPNGTNQVLQVVGWDGGSGTVPATGLYVGSTGYVSNITDGINIKGADGAAGGGGGIAVNFTGGNSLGNTFSAGSGTVNWFGGSNVTLSLDSAGKNVSIIGANQLQFSNTNGVTFGINAGTVTASVNTNYQAPGAYLTTAMLSNAGSNFVGLNSAITNGLMTANSSGISLNLSNHLTTAMLSNAGSNFVGLNSAMTGGSMTLNSSGLSISLPNYLTTAMQSNASSVFAGTGTTFAGTNVSGSMTLNSNGLNLALSAGAGGGGGSVNFSAGTTSNNLAAITFSNANGVSFGLNGSVMTGSVAAAGGAQTGISGISAGTTVLTNGTLSFGNGSGVTFGLNGSVLTATVATNYQSQGAYLTTAMASNAATISNINFSAGTTSGNLSALTFANSNGVSFGLNNGTVTATVATNYQSQGAYLTTAMQSNAATISNINFSAGTTSGNLSALTFANSNGVSFGLNGGTVTATVATNYQSQGAYLTTAMVSNAGSNFIGLNTAITNGLMTANSSGISLNLSNLLTTAMASNAGSNFVGLNSAITNGLMTVNSSGISLNLSNHLTTAMLSNQSTNFAGLGTTFNGANISGSMTLNTAGLNLSLSAAAGGGGADGYNIVQLGTTGTSGASFSTSAGTLFFNGANGFIVSQTSNTINFVDNDIWYINGNTAGAQSSSQYSNGLFLSGGANITLSQNGSTLAIIGGAGGGGGSINVSAGTTSNNLTALTYANSNGVSFGLNGSVVTATVATNYQSQGAYLTTAMQSNAATISNINLSAGTTSSNISAFVFSNSNNVSFGLTNGSQVTASATFAAQTVQPMYYSASGTSSSSGTLQFGNTQGVSFSLSNGSIVGSVATNYQSQGAYLTTAMASNAGSNFVGLGSAITNGTMTFNSAGLSLNLSNHLTTAMASNAGSNFVGLNTAGTNATFTLNSSGFSFNGGAYLTTAMASNAGSNFVGLNSAVTGASLTVNSSGISINVPAAAPSPVYVIAGTTNGSLGTISFVNSNGVSFGLNGSTITASAAGGGGGGVAIANSQTTYTSGTANFVGSGALTVGSTTGQSYYISAPALSSLSATGVLSISTNGNTISMGVAATTLSVFQPYQLANSSYVSLGNTAPLWLPMFPPENISMSVAEIISSLSFSSYSSTWNKGFTVSYGLYSQGTGTNNTTMGLMNSSSFAMIVSASSSATFGITLSQGANSTTYGSANSSHSALTGQKVVLLPYAGSMAANGNYFFGMISSSSSAGSNVNATVSFMVNNAWSNASLGILAPNTMAASTFTNVHEPFGFGYSAGTAAFPATVAFSQGSVQSNLQPYVLFEN